MTKFSKSQLRSQSPAAAAELLQVSLLLSLTLCWMQTRCDNSRTNANHGWSLWNTDSVQVCTSDQTHSVICFPPHTETKTLGHLNILQQNATQCRKCCDFGDKLFHHWIKKCSVANCDQKVCLSLSIRGHRGAHTLMI